MLKLLGGIKNGLKNMRNYQLLSLIGCVLGILLMLSVWICINVIMGYSKSGDLAELTANKEIQASLGKITFFPANTFISIAVYIICLAVAFVVETKTMAVGIILIVLGIIPIAITNLVGIIPFAILLTAGMVALTSKFVSICKKGHINPDSSKYCNECGLQFVSICKKGHINPDSSKYCYECGLQLV